MSCKHLKGCFLDFYTLERDMELFIHFEHWYQISILVNHISQTLNGSVNPWASDQINMIEINSWKVNTHIPSVSPYVALKVHCVGF